MWTARSPCTAIPGTRCAARFTGAVQLARLLVRHGRGEEATEVLRSLADSPGGAEDWIVSMLCTHYAEQGRAEDGPAYLDALKTRHGAEDWELFRMRLPLMAACGRREEAIALAQAHPEVTIWCSCCGGRTRRCGYTGAAPTAYGG